MVKSTDQIIMMNSINLGSLSADEIDLLAELQPSKYKVFWDFITSLLEKRKTKSLKFSHLSEVQYKYLVVGLAGKLRELYTFDTFRQRTNN